MDSGFKVDENRLWRLVCRQDATYQLVRGVTDETAARANDLSAGFRTGKYHRDHKSPAVGGTQARYGSNTQRPHGIVPAGVVHPLNYAAMKDNHLHNTLLKALR